MGEKNSPNAIKIASRIRNDTFLRVLLHFERIPGKHKTFKHFSENFLKRVLAGSWCLLDKKVLQCGESLFATTCTSDKRGSLLCEAAPLSHTQGKKCIIWNARKNPLEKCGVFLKAGVQGVKRISKLLIWTEQQRQNGFSFMRFVSLSFSFSKNYRCWHKE